MTQHNPLDQKGNFQAYPLAELLAETEQAHLSGSLRVSRAEQKAVVYFDQGKVIFAVSNAKALRLFNVMLQNNKIEREALAAFPNFANDMEFAMSLRESGRFSNEEVDGTFTIQIEAIIVDALSWPDGEWHFSPISLKRLTIRSRRR